MRLGAAKVMSRPALGYAHAWWHGERRGNNRDATFGNPGIDPTRAKNYDLAARVVFRARIAARPRAVLQGHREPPAEHLADEPGVHRQPVRHSRQRCRRSLRRARELRPDSRRLDVQLHRQRRRRRAEGLRVQLSAALHVPAGLLVASAPSSTTRGWSPRSSTSIRSLADGHGGPHGSFAPRLQRHAVLRDGTLRRARLGGLPRRIPRPGQRRAWPRRQQSRRRRRDADASMRRCATRSRTTST